MDYDFLREIYFRELEERHQQDGRITLQAGVLTIGGGVLASMFKAFPPEQSPLYVCFLLPATASAVLFLLALVWILRANIGHDYVRLPYPSTLRDYGRELEVYYAARDSVEEVAREYRSYVQDRMIEATDYNIATNLKRSACYYTANSLIAWMVISFLVAGVPVLINLTDSGIDTGVQHGRQADGQAWGEAVRADSFDASQEAGAASEPDLQGRPESASPERRNAEGVEDDR
jgi:hypothetical protein